MDFYKNHLLDNTLIIVTGDHGQEINDTRNNFWGHNSSFTKYQTEVPLMIYDKNRKGTVIEYTTNHYDVAPTILTHEYGCTNLPQDYSIGMDLFDNTPRPFSLISSYTKKAVRTGNKITVIDAYGNLEYYDNEFKPLTNGADPAAMVEALKTFSKFYN
jgi:membrane-anchored protein YejM (alkaline phosphatase superfamily)